MKVIQTLYWIALLCLLLWGGSLVLNYFRTPQVLIPPRGDFLTVEGQKLHYLQKGEGRTILFLHGFPYHLEAYRELFANAWPGYRLVALDLPGLGLSEKNSAVSSSPAQLALLIKLFLDRLEIKSVDVVGHDLGGGVAIVLAASYPHQVRNLVLIAPDSSAGQSGRRLGWWWRLPVLGELWTRCFLGRNFIRQTMAQGWVPDNTDWMNYVERYYQPLHGTHAWEGFYNLNRGRYPFQYRLYEEQLRAPLLVFWGKRDQVIPWEQGRHWAELLGAKFHPLAGAGHLCLEPAAGELYKATLAFLDSRPQETTPVPRPIPAMVPETEEPVLPAEEAPPVKIAPRSKAVPTAAAVEPAIIETPVPTTEVVPAATESVVTPAK